MLHLWRSERRYFGLRMSTPPVCRKYTLVAFTAIALGSFWFVYRTTLVRDSVVPEHLR